MPTALHPKRWWNFCMPEDSKKEIEPVFVELCFYTDWEYWNMLPLDIVQKPLWISCYFDTKRLDIV